MRLTGVLFVLHTGFTVNLILKLIRLVQCNGSIGYFNESAEARLPLTKIWHINNRVGFSFRTCKYGELLSQVGANGDYFKLSLLNTSLEFQWKVEDNIGSLTVGSELSNNQWYNVDFYFYLGAIHLNVSKGGTLLSNTLISDSIHRPFLQYVNLTGGSELTVGQGFTGCIAQGPFINLTQPELQSTSIIWNECRLPPRGGCSAADRDINDCWSNPCYNGGKCIDEFQNYTCRCLPAYNGSRCENDLSYLGCIINPCQNNGTCEDQPQGQTRNYKCTCTSGFNGVNCETNLDECGVNPCLNNGKCIDGINSYTCNCSGTGYHGLTCNEDVNECNGDPCGTGDCYNNFGSYSCVCADGYTGYKCLQNINECDSSPCKNSATCNDLVNDYSCDCILGFTGKNCQENIDDCLSVNATCPGSHSVCVDGVNSYSCECRSGYSGIPPNCQDIDECKSNPCKNSATCLNKEDAYECDCVAGYNGTNCDNNIDDCAGNPCQNNASCSDGIANYTCHCLTGFNGQDCEINIDDCRPDSCLNGGTCTDLVNDFSCSCVAGWNGDHCDVNINECKPNPCLNGGSCRDLINAFNCTCLQGFTDSNCSTNINDCDPNPCNNSGRCIDGVNAFTCNCTSDWMGSTCDQVYDACSFQPCENSGTCATMNPSHDYNCTCVLGFQGNNCQENIDDCEGVVCPNQYHKCFDEVNNYTCACPIGYSGDNCSVDINECASNPCQYGQCHNSIGKYVCECQQELIDLSQHYPGISYVSGYNGTNCEKDINECSYNPPICLNGAECRNKNGSFQCICIPDENNVYYTGRHCDISTTYCEDSNDIVKNDPPACKNGGTCIPDVDSFSCVCAPGFNESRCTHNIDECLLEVEPCQYNGTCKDGINGYSCECIPGITGPKCEVNIDECAAVPCWNDSECCLNGGRCIDAINDYSCNCSDTGFKGDHCEVNIDDCLPDPCKNGGTCQDGVKNYTCSCYPGYAGYDCEIDINECSSNPCQYYGTCLEKSNMTLYEINYPGYHDFSYSRAAGYYCICVAGISGKNCETNLPDCYPDSCYNGATCIDGINEFSCNCAKGFRGDQCETNINECTEYGPPCKNGGVCTDLVAAYECSCPEFHLGKQYGGKNCTFELTSCQMHTCQNGTCQPYLVNELTSEQAYRCLCDAGFTGAMCNVSTTMSFLEPTSYLYHGPSQHSNGSLSVSFQFRTTLSEALLFAINFNASSSVFVELYQSELTVTLFNIEGAASLRSQKISVHVTDARWKQINMKINNTLYLELQHSSCVGDGCKLQINLGQDFSQYETMYFGNNFQLSSTRSQRYFTGCMQDVMVDGIYKLPNDAVGVLTGCPRTDQCHPDPCNSHGMCDDLWDKFECDCRRPYLGSTCADEYTAATFYHENLSSSATFTLPTEQQETLKTKIELSMFVRTRESDGLIMFMGNKQASYLTVEMLNGAIASRLYLCGLSKFIASPNKDNNGQQVFVELSLMDAHLTLTVNNVVAENISLVAPTCDFIANTIKFGGSTVDSRRKRSIIEGVSLNDFTYTAFKGTVQDARLNEMSLLFFDFISNSSLSVPNVTTSAMNGVVKTEVTDDLCTSLSPCENNSTCSNRFFNDYWCDCPLGYRGKNCSELNFCVLGKCPDGATCESISDGFECQSPVTFYSPNSVMVYKHNLLPDRTIGNITFKLRTRIFNGILMTINNDLYPVQMALVNGIIKVHIQYNSTTSELSGQQLLNDGKWYSVELITKDDSLQVNVRHEDGTLYDTTNGALSPPNILTDIFHSDTSVLVGGKVSPDVKSIYRHQFKGCLNDIRVGGILLPPYFDADILNNTAAEKFELQLRTEVNTGCHSVDSCLHNRCHNSGQCADIWNDYTCSCLDGYSGQYCEVNTDDCSNNDCRNGGRCLDGINMYTCQCFPGSAGPRCETTVSECGSSPCQNNATCTDLVADYNCSCPAEYTGKSCETSIIQNCSDNLCKNGGLCSPLNISLNFVIVESFNCSCLPGYYGPLCEEVTNYCENLPCLNGGNCTSNVSAQNYTCVCPTGFSGYNCEINKNDCHPDSCSHEGECIDGINSYFCNCTEGWTGQICNEDINECNTTQPCFKGACQNTQGGYSCNCEPGYTGPTCDTDINECNLTEEVCQNGASCNNTEGSYSCNCTLGYEGKNCSMPNCTHGQCLNSGSCHVKFNKWECDCPAFYEGDQCELRGLCADDPCHTSNTASCIQNITENTYTCICNPGWEGINCTEDVDECKNDTLCLNGANCTNNPGSFKCNCVPGYSGQYCQTDINECAVNPCKNGSPCTDQINNYFCNCSGTGYEGQDCNKDINECNNSVCENAGDCTNLPGDFSCSCTPGYGGKRCHIDDPCIKSEPCQNGATCTTVFHEEKDTANFSCFCTDAYEGKFCETADPTRERLDDNDDIYIIVGVVAAVLIIVLVIVLFFVVTQIRKKRATRGAYSPSRQEMSGSRIELGNNKLKIPPEERLI